MQWAPKKWGCAAGPAGAAEAKAGADDDDGEKVGNAVAAPTPESTLSHGFQLESCFDPWLRPGAENADVPFTTLTPGFDGTLDWIFVDRTALRIDRVWDPYPVDVLEAEEALPSSKFPSDHVAVVAEVAWRVNKLK